MKKVSHISIVSAIILLLFTGGILSAQPRTIISEDIISLTDSAISTTFTESEIDGSLTLSWNEGEIGTSGGFGNLVAYTPFPGGRYQVLLLAVISSTADEIQGIWSVTKNDRPQQVVLGSAFNLSAAVGQTINIVVGDLAIQARVTTRFSGIQAPQTVTGQAKANNIPLVGVLTRLRTTDGTIIDQTTDTNGEYLFIDVPPDNFRNLVIAFRNVLSEVTLSGHIQVGGEPLVGAIVSVRDPSNNVLATTVTDESGAYNVPTITGAGGLNLRTIITR